MTSQQKHQKKTQLKAQIVNRECTLNICCCGCEKGEKERKKNTLKTRTHEKRYENAFYSFRSVVLSYIVGCVFGVFFSPLLLLLSFSSSVILCIKFSFGYVLYCLIMR